MSREVLDTDIAELEKEIVATKTNIHDYIEHNIIIN